MRGGPKCKKMLFILGQRYFDPTDLPDEIWKYVPEQCGKCRDGLYQVSNKGRVKNPVGQILAGGIDDHGYHIVVLSRPSGTKSFHMHYLVLVVFGILPPSTISNCTVQHKNHNKLDNRIENLTWMSAEDNNRDGHGTKIHFIDTDEYFESRILASLSIGRWHGYISECMFNDKPVKDKLGNEIHFEYSRPGHIDEWVEYKPSKLACPGPKMCKIIDKTGEHNFDCMSAADRYIGRYEGYIRYRFIHNFKIYNMNEEEVVFELLTC